MTSANRSSEPIAYEDQDAMDRLSGIADAFLIGERPIARRVDDSVARVGAFGPAILRRSRGYAPGAVASFPEQSTNRPILAVGPDLKNTVTLVVEGQAFVSQHIGDLDHYEAFRAFDETIRDLMTMYEIRWEDMLLAHDAHPEYRSTLHALRLPAQRSLPFSITALMLLRCLRSAANGKSGFLESASMAPAMETTAAFGAERYSRAACRAGSSGLRTRTGGLSGGDAAAHYPVQAAAGFLAQIEGLPI